MAEDSSPAPRRRFGYVALFVALLLGLVGGGLATGAAIHHHFGHGFMGHGWRHHGPVDATEVKEHTGHMVDHLAREVDATAEQKQQLTTIANALADDLVVVHQKMHDSRDRLVALLKAPKTDRAALEALRAEHVALADSVSKRIAQAFADAADVLTPEQRAKLVEHWDF